VTLKPSFTFKVTFHLQQLYIKKRDKVFLLMEDDKPGKRKKFEDLNIRPKIFGENNAMVVSGKQGGTPMVSNVGKSTIA
jgi:hypothetical protein